MFKTKYRIVEFENGEFVVRRTRFFINDYYVKLLFSGFFFTLGKKNADRFPSRLSATTALERVLQETNGDKYKIKKVHK